ncbi:Heat shock 70 kDa protein 3 [Acorus gramineus]|uniref:Heat shock 70 kDa protein 3 n=1 Tax=Acorus gramineus TaxID=55184 RepID=A0AAV9B178_ACOGR|nr:Heat shock 70 kDa protein 3 [Acorus gramineus]
MSSDPNAVLMLKKTCERAKRVLSFEKQASIEIPCLFEVIIFYSIITRSRFEDLNGDFFMRCIELFQTCMSYAPVEKDEIEEVILLGGSSQIPKVQQLLCEHLRGKIFPQFIGTEAVAFGATMKELSTRKAFNDVVPKFYEVNPYSINLKTSSGI